MLNEALLPRQQQSSSSSAAAAAEEKEPDRADLNRDILLAAAGLLPDSVGSTQVRISEGGRGRQGGGSSIRGLMWSDRSKGVDLDWVD